MSSNQVTITIKASDGASTVFKAIGSSAQSMGQSVSTAGTTAEAGLSKFQAAASKTSSVLESIGHAASGVVGQELTQFFTEAASASAELQASQARLEASFQALGHSTEEYGSQLEQVTQHAQAMGFTERSATDALSRLVQVTGNAGDSLKILGVAEDLARARGMDLVTASQLVARAYDGQGSALKRYGIVLLDGAKGMEAVSQVEQHVAGQADAFANTTAGAIARAQAAFESFTESLGGLAGPLQAGVILLPGLAQGFNTVGGAGAKFSASLAEDGAAATALEAAISPLGLAIGAVGIALAAGIAIWVNYQNQLAAFDKAAAAARQEIDATETSLKGLNQVADAALAQPNLGAMDTFRLGLTAIGKDTTDYLLTVQQANDANQGFADSFAKLGQTMQVDVLSAFQLLYNQFQQGTVKAQDFANTFKQIGDIANYTGFGSGKLQQELDGVIKDFDSGIIKAPEFEQKVASLSTEMDSLSQHAANSANTFSTWGAMADGTQVALHDLTQATIQAGAEWEKQQAEVQKVADTYDQAKTGVEGFGGVLDGFVQQGESVTAVLDRVAHASDQFSTSFADALEKVQAQGQGLSNAVSSLQAVLSIYKEIDTIGGASSSAQKIAQNLVGDPGVYAAVDDWFNKIVADSAGMANQQQQIAQAQQTYNAAVQAGYDIEQQDLAVQQDMQTTRLALLPTLAQEEDALRGQADALAQLAQTNPELAQQQLYLMDSGNAAKVAAQFTLAYGASLGQIPKSVATEMILDAAKADPVLAGILEKYGLIPKDFTTNAHVNFPDAKTLDDTVAAINQLKGVNIVIAMALTGDVAGAKQTLADIEAAAAKPYTITLTAIDQASQAFNKPIQLAATYDQTTADAVLGVQDNASQPIANVAGAVKNIDNTTATVTVDANTAPFEASIAGLGQNVKPIEIPVVPMQQGVVGVQYTAPKEAPSVQAPAAPPPVPITADISPFTASLQTAEAEGANFAQQTYQAHLGLDLTQFNTQFPSVITEAAGFASQTYQAKLSADSGDAAAAIQTAIQEGEGFAKQTYTATLSAQDNTGDVLVNASSNAHAFANAEYQASLTANDAASSVIAIPQAAATAFATTYTGTLETTDNASNVITTATGLALAFATTYSADLEAVDNASGVIATVTDELNGLDGKTATTYINTVTNNPQSSQPAGQYGGQLGRVMQAMALGGTASGIPVLVGEAGPEIAFLPLGTQVIPHGASVAAMQGGGTVGSTQSSLQPNTAQATSAGQKDGVAYYQGLLSAVKSQKQTLHGEIFGNTLFTSAAAAKPGLDALSNLGQQHDQLVQQLQEARQDQQNLGKAATTAGTAMTTAATSATTAIQGTTQATGRLATMIGKLQSLHSLVGGAGGGSGAVDPIKQAIQSFEQTALSSLGQVQQASQDTGQALNQDIGKGANQAAGQVSNATGQMSSDLSQLPKDAATSGKAAGAAIGQGLSQGIQKSNVSDQISGVQQQLQQLGSTTQGPSIGVNDQQAQQGIQGVQQGLSQLNGQNAAVGVNVNTSQWDKFVQNFKSLDGQSVTVTVNQKTNTSGGGGGGGGGKTPPPSGQGGGGGGGKNPPPSGQAPASLNLPLSALVPQSALGRTATVLPGVPAPVSVAGTGRPTQFVNYGHIHIHPHTADLYQEIAGAFAQMGRW